jgi:hypothetical protein
MRATTPPPTVTPTSRRPPRWLRARSLTVYIDGDFDAAERERIGLALRQWSHVLNGFVRLRPVLLPADASDGAVAQLRRQGAWIVAKVDSRHPAARSQRACHDGGQSRQRTIRTAI